MMQWSSALLDNNTKTTVQDTCMVKWVIIWAHINDPWFLLFSLSLPPNSQRCIESPFVGRELE